MKNLTFKSATAVSYLPRPCTVAEGAKLMDKPSGISVSKVELEAMLKLIHARCWLDENAPNWQKNMLSECRQSELPSTVEKLPRRYLSYETVVQMEKQDRLFREKKQKLDCLRVPSSCQYIFHTPAIDLRQHWEGAAGLRGGLDFDLELIHSLALREADKAHGLEPEVKARVKARAVLYCTQSVVRSEVLTPQDEITTGPSSGPEIDLINLLVEVLIRCLTLGMKQVLTSFQRLNTKDMPTNLEPVTA
jgi:hypothetical protein